MAGISLQDLQDIMSMQRAHSQGLMDQEQGIRSTGQSAPYEYVFPMVRGANFDPSAMPESRPMAMRAAYETAQPQPSVALKNLPKMMGGDRLLDQMPDEMSFAQAFGQARRGGLLTFTWRGKKYTTRVA